jgi:hypothetical protein
MGSESLACFNQVSIRLATAQEHRFKGAVWTAARAAHRLVSTASAKKNASGSCSPAMSRNLGQCGPVRTDRADRGGPGPVHRLRAQLLLRRVLYLNRGASVAASLIAW